MSTDLEYYFENVDVPTLKEQMRKSKGWFRSIVAQIRRRPVKFSKLLFGDTENITRKLIVGKMYIFHYQAKYGEKLPIWDEWPLILLIGRERGGFYGVNLHYVEYNSRAWLLNRLIENSKVMATANDRVALSAHTLMRFSRIDPDKSTKHYLLDHVKGSFREVPIADWPKVILLPSYKFHRNKK